MKTIKERKQFLRDNWKLSTLNFTWSKAGVCTLKNKRNEKLASAGGYGYDKKGTALGQVINSVFQEEIKKLSSKKFYGLNHYNTKTRKYQVKSSDNTKTFVDGACGFSTMTSILNKIGFDLEWIIENDKQIVYKLDLRKTKFY
jgi:hypothetical protein